MQVGGWPEVYQERRQDKLTIICKHGQASETQALSPSSLAFKALGKNPHG